MSPPPARLPVGQARRTPGWHFLAEPLATLIGKEALIEFAGETYAALQKLYAEKDKAADEFFVRRYLRAQELWTKIDKSVDASFAEIDDYFEWAMRAADSWLPRDPDKGAPAPPAFSPNALAGRIYARRRPPLPGAKTK